MCFQLQKHTNSGAQLVTFFPTLRQGTALWDPSVNQALGKVWVRQLPFDHAPFLSRKPKYVLGNINSGRREITLASPFRADTYQLIYVSISLQRDAFLPVFFFYFGHGPPFCLFVAQQSVYLSKSELSQIKSQQVPRDLLHLSIPQCMLRQRLHFRKIRDSKSFISVVTAQDMELVLLNFAKKW